MMSVLGCTIVNRQHIPGLGYTVNITKQRSLDLNAAKFEIETSPFCIVKHKTDIMVGEAVVIGHYKDEVIVIERHNDSCQLLFGYIQEGDQK